MIVVDASATLAWLFGESDAVGWLRTRLATDQLIAPALWRLEVVNAVLKKERQRLISVEEGTEFVQILDGLPVATCEPPGSRTLADLARFARGHQLTSYDAIYLELARDRQAPLLTLDGNLRDAAGRLGVVVIAA